MSATSGAPRLSLIVPVYNVAPFLPRCLESLAALAPQSTEVLLVDDGSTDESAALLRDWAAARPQARLLRQENAGLAAARNAGLAQARGHYLAFVDSDDYFDADYHARLAALCEAQELDMAIGNASYHFEGRLPDRPIYSDAPPDRVMSGADFLRYRLRARALLHMVWMHLYRRDWLEAQGLRFAPQRIHEDVPWTTRLLLQAKRLRYDATPGYHYRQRVRRFAPEAADARLETILASSLANARELDELVAGLRGDAELQQLLRWQLVDGGLSMFHKVRQLSGSGLRRNRLRQLRAEGAFRLLWRNASGLAQHRRIARNWLRSIAGLA